MDGIASGEGRLTWAGGARYEGKNRDGKRHGHGTLTLAVFPNIDSVAWPFANQDDAEGVGDAPETIIDWVDITDELQ